MKVGDLQIYCIQLHGKRRTSVLIKMRVIETYSSSRRPRPRNQGNRHTDKLCLHMTHHSNAAGHPYMLAQKQKRHAKQR